MKATKEWFNIPITGSPKITRILKEKRWMEGDFSLKQENVLIVIHISSNPIVFFVHWVPSTIRINEEDDWHWTFVSKNVHFEVIHEIVPIQHQLSNANQEIYSYHQNLIVQYRRRPVFKRFIKWKEKIVDGMSYIIQCFDFIFIVLKNVTISTKRKKKGIDEKNSINERETRFTSFEVTILLYTCDPLLETILMNRHDCLCDNSISINGRMSCFILCSSYFSIFL